MDWRIPNSFELESIVKLQNDLPAVDTVFNIGCVQSCTVTSCSCTLFNAYWSSTTFAASPYYAWVVTFGYGYLFYFDKGDYYYVRAVRGGS